MSKNIRIISSLFLAAFILYGCSSTPKKEDTLTKTAESTQQDTVASSDTSAPLPVDSTDVDENLPSNGKDALRRIQSRIPFDRQIKEQQTVEAPKTEENAPLVKEKIKAEYYSVQLGAFSSDENASKFAFSSPVRKLAMMPSVRLNPANGLFVVQYGRFKTRFEAERALKELKKKNFKDVFIVKTNE